MESSAFPDMRRVSRVDLVSMTGTRNWSDFQKIQVGTNTSSAPCPDFVAATFRKFWPRLARNDTSWEFISPHSLSRAFCKVTCIRKTQYTINAVAICPTVGKGLKKTKCPTVVKMTYFFIEMDFNQPQMKTLL